jgi:hypothetical protein
MIPPAAQPHAHRDMPVFAALSPSSPAARAPCSVWQASTLPVLTLALAAILTGCGNTMKGGDRARSAPAVMRHGTPAALRTVLAAAHETLAHPAMVEFTLEGSQALGSSPAPVLGSGEFDFPTGVGSEAIDLGEAAHQERGTEHVTFLPSRVYLQPKSSSTTVLPKGKGWVSATLTGSDSVRTNFPLFVLQVEGINPQFLLGELAGGAVAAVPVGQVTVDREHTREFNVTVDLTRALSASSGLAGTVFGQAIQSELTHSSGAQPLPTGGTSIRAWVDDAGHMIQLQTAPPGAGLGTVTMTMCCFGEAVNVAVPPPSQVIDITSLTPSGERENNGGGDSDGG